MNIEKYIYILKAKIAPFTTRDIEQIHKEKSFYLEPEESDLNFFRSKKCETFYISEHVKKNGIPENIRRI